VSLTRTDSPLATIATLVLALVACSSEHPSDAPGSSAPPESAPAEVAPLAGEFAPLDPLEPAAGVEAVVPTLSDLPIPVSKRTMRYVQDWSQSPKGREGFEGRYQRSLRLRDVIVRALQEARLPEDLLYVAAIESAFNVQARSDQGGSGIFQLSAELGRALGLAITEEIDERRSVPRATEATVVHLGALLDRYGTWDLALAAFDCGERCVDDAITSAREKLSRGADGLVSFAELAELELLPLATREYVPQVHAFAICAHNRPALGLAEVEVASPPPLAFAEVAVPAGSRLSTIARVSGLTLGELQELNPQFLKDTVPDLGADAIVYVPPERLAQALAALPAALASDATVVTPPRARAATSTDVETRAPSPRPPSPRSDEPSPARGGDRAAAPVERSLEKAPLRPGTFVLPSGVFVRFEEAATDTLGVSAEIVTVDPLSNRKPIGEPVTLAERKLGADRREGLRELASELATLVDTRARPSLRAEVDRRRRKLYERTTRLAPFEALSSWAFPTNHPSAGLLLVGPTEPADDTFLEPEPTWAFEITLTVRGPDPESLGRELAAPFADLTSPKKLAALPRSAVVGADGQTTLVAYASAPGPRGSEGAQQIAFLLACHNKLGRLHRALRHEGRLATDVACALETTPHANVAWVLVSPQSPHTVAEVDAAITAALQRLIDEGVSETELSAGRGLVRAEAAREVQTAVLRGHPKSRVQAQVADLLATIDGTTREDLEGTFARLFPSERRFVWRGR
jgi:hypothetical protein